MRCDCIDRIIAALCVCLSVHWAHLWLKCVKSYFLHSLSLDFDYLACECLCVRVCSIFATLEKLILDKAKSLQSLIRHRSISFCCYCYCCVSILFLIYRAVLLLHSLDLCVCCVFMNVYCQQRLYILF